MAGFERRMRVLLDDELDRLGPLATPDLAGQPKRKVDAGQTPAAMTIFPEHTTRSPIGKHTYSQDQPESPKAPIAEDVHSRHRHAALSDSTSETLGLLFAAGDVGNAGLSNPFPLPCSSWLQQDFS